MMFSISLIKLRNTSTPILKEPALNGFKYWIRRAHMQIQVGGFEVPFAVCNANENGSI